MDSVALAALYLEYPPSSVFNVTRILQLAESMYGSGTKGYQQYVDKYTQPSEKGLIERMNTLMTESSSREYMGVTIYSDDGLYSVPELGIYNIEDSKDVKNAVKIKLSQTSKPKSIKEDADEVIDRIFSYASIDENQFLKFVLEQMTESDYTALGGSNFKNFVILISEIVQEIDEVPLSLINENYIFDESFGDFVKKVKTGIDDAHLNLSYISPTAAAAAGNAYKRHSDAVGGLKNKLNSASNVTADVANSAKNKIKGAVQKGLNKDNLKMGARIAGAGVKAASTGFNKSVAAVAGNAVAGVKAAASLTDKELTNRSKSEPVKKSLSTEHNRKKISAANGVLDRLRTDGDAEKQTISPKPKRLTSKEKEAKYKDYLKSGNLDKDLKSMKEDVDFQLDFIKHWLFENEIFDSENDIDLYILEQMTQEEYMFILSEVQVTDDAVADFVGNAKRRSVGKVDSKTRVSNKQWNNNLDFHYRKYKEGFGKNGGNDSSAATKPTLGKAIAPPKDRNALVPSGGNYNKPLGRPMASPSNPTKPTLGKAIAPPKDRNALVPSGGNYNKPLGRPMASPSKPLGKAIDNPHSLAYKDAIAALHEPAAKDRPYNRFDGGKLTEPDNSSRYPVQDTTAYHEPAVKAKPYDRMGYSGISRDNLTTVGGRTSKTLLPVKSDDFANSLSNTFKNKKVKPSSLVSVVGNKSKKIANHVISGIKNKLFGESLTEHDIKNWISEEEFLEIVEWLVENDVFEEDDELIEYLCEGLNWEEVGEILHDIDQTAVELIVDSLCDEQLCEQTYIVLDSLLGEEFVNIYESMNIDSDFYEPMPIKAVDCSCGKSGCKTCSKKSWKAKVYNKMSGGL